MADEIGTASHAIVELTTDVVSAYVAKNSVSASSLPEIISSVHAAFTALSAPVPPPEAEKPVPAVPIKKSVTPDYLISLEDGRRYKSLKRHLSGKGLTPAEYRAKWGLPKDYPMVAPNYAATRSALAKSMGLGRKRTAASEQAPQEAAAPAKKRGRRKAA
jgi:MucR family transcriptional regulator, transcriptional regulator of exopolysaccharide biosynthesis